MPKPSKRRFLISDAMVLIAATAVGIALTKAIMPDFTALSLSAGGALSRFLQIEYVLNCVVPTLFAWTIALLLLRLRQPRPRRGRVFLQPGAAACAAAIIASTVSAGLTMVIWAMGSRIIHFYNVVSATHVAGYAILGAWLVLILSEKWRPDHRWIDRAGTVIGAIWIVVTIVSWARLFFV